MTTGMDLINYIHEHHLENVEIDTGSSDPLQFIVTIPADEVSGEREIVYDFTRELIYEKYIGVKEITDKEAEEIRGIDISRGRNCTDCDHFSHFYNTCGLHNYKEIKNPEHNVCDDYEFYGR